MTQILLQDKSKKGVDAVTLSIWDRNLQFAFWSVMFGVCSLGMDTSWIARGLFAEWTPLTVLLVLVCSLYIDLSFNDFDPNLSY